ncbi:MAG: DegT/DnrJ/EryC1/StrS family aminotransferase [Selenomonadaceae bacterium]|nr:DegT/DnrJ/EryC1/StrS family aminotransferase [Selenomonadaceae bacterium]
MEYRDLKKQYQVLKKEMDAAIEGICSSARFIGGEPVKELEKQLAAYVGVKHCITCANGTDALQLALMAWGIGKGDAVIVPDFTYFSSGEVVAAVGATPIFVDVDARTYNIDPAKLEERIADLEREKKYRVKAVIAVDLFGLPADYDAIRPICEEHNLLLLEDGAQGFGGALHEHRACSFGDISTTSFFPAKPVGCYGDGGAIFTDNDEWAALMRSYAVHGKGASKYDNIRVGMNSRLDTLQAAILQIKLKAFRGYELSDINAVAAKYTKLLQDTPLVLPTVANGFTSSWAQYTVQLPEGTDRDKVMAQLKEQGIPTMVYYLKPMHQQKAFAGTDSAAADCPITDRITTTVMSLPLDPYKTDEDIQTVAAAVKKLLQK